MSLVGMLVQQESGGATSFWETVPTSVQVLVGGVVLASAGWTWFLRPRMSSLMFEAVSGLRQEITDTREGLRQEITDTREGLRQEITDTREGLRQEIADNTAALRQEIADTREGLRQEIADTREGLRQEIADNTAALRKEITDNTAALRKEIADNTITLRKESQEAHAAIGDRIDRLQDFVARENKDIRADIADMKADTAKLAGAVDVLKAMVLRGGGPAEAART